jgi:AraC family transcriptional regulator, ethanolamine operon transcriptional activator
VNRLENRLAFEPVFAAGSWVSDSQFSDIDAQAAQYQGYEQQYQQLSPGPFRGRLRSFDFGGDLVINFEMANREIAASAATPRGRFGACFLADRSPECALNASEFSQDHVVLSPEAVTVEGRMSADVSMFCMDMSAALLPDSGEPRKVVGVRENALATQRLRGLVHSGIEHFRKLETPNAYPAALIGFKSAVADVLWQLITPSSADAASSRVYATSRALFVFKRARDIIEHHLADGISITTLCRSTGVSRRSLESVFRAVVGIGPSGYIRTLQLNEVRRDLLATVDGEESIGMIAARRGIWHWSRFSSYYRDMFGELPSETRRGHGSNMGLEQ